MLNSLKHLRVRETVPRIWADFVIVQIAALISLVYVLIFRVRSSPDEHGYVLKALLQGYYTDVFLPLSIIFPIIFLFTGVYTKARHYNMTYKCREVGKSCLLATGVVFAANFLLTRNAFVPRRSVVLFAILVACGTIGIRKLKHYLFDTEITGVINGVSLAARDDKILVVGGAGYVGSVLVRLLLSRGRQVKVLDTCIYGKESLRELSSDPRLEVIVGDCRNIQNVVAAVRDVRSIVHLAAIVGDPACDLDRRTALDINYASTRMIAEIAKGYKVERFVFASSCSVYGASDFLADEASCTHPISLYAQTKVDSENALLASRTDEFHPIILRFATVFGHSYRPRFDLVVNLLTARAMQEGVITIYNGEQWRPFIHVRDVAEAIIGALEAPLVMVGGEIFNVGDAKLNCTLTELAQRIRRVLPATKLEHVQNADRRNYRVSFNKLTEHTGFKCSLSLEDGIVEIKNAIETKAVSHYKDLKYHNYTFLKETDCHGGISDLDTDIMAAFSRPTGILPEGVALATLSRKQRTKGLRGQTGVGA